MTTLRYAAVLAALWGAFVFQTQAQPWRGPNGSPSPSSESRGEVDGFSAMVLVTPDLDWQEKWNTPPDTIPNFREASTIVRGETVAILPFLSGPRIVDGRIDTTVDLRILQPDGVPQVDQKAAPCLTGPVGEIGANVLLCQTSLGFFASPTDPLGEYQVEIVVRDRHRNVEVPLRARFQLVEAGVAKEGPQPRPEGQGAPQQSE